MAFAPARSWLAEQHLAPLLSSNMHHLVSVAKWEPVLHASKKLEQANILSVPVLDEDNEYFGCVSANDLLKSLVHGLDQVDKEWLEKVSTMTPEQLAKIGEEFNHQKVEKLQHAGDLWLLTADSSSSVLDAINESFRIQDHHVHHRLYVCTNAHEQKANTTQGLTTVVNITAGSERRAASGWTVTGVVSQYDVIKMLAANPDKLGEGAAKTVEQLELDAGAVFTVPATMTTLEAFGRMGRDHKSALGVVDPASGVLIGNLSVSDIRGLDAADFPLLLLPVGEFILVRHKLATAPADVKAAPARANWAEALKALPVVTVGLATSFKDVLQALVSKHLHRVYVVDGEGKPISIVTLTDALRAVSKQ